MKIIAVGMNYARHNKELGHTQDKYGTGDFYEARFRYPER